MTADAPIVVVVGGGFGGLMAARALKHAPVKVVLIDKTNHHLFQPLLYQVATSVLSPGQIASPIRGILQNQKNATVMLGTVTGVNAAPRQIVVDFNDRKGVSIAYDYLVLATGQSQSYFGHSEFEQFAPGIKSLADAVAVRNKILNAFETAEAEEDPQKHQELLTLVLVGGGPTGVEMASAIAFLVRSTLKKDFRKIDPASARIILADAGKRPLATFPPGLSAAALKRLTEMGVEVRLGSPVEAVDANGVTIAGERILCKTVIWTAGVAPSPAGKWLNAETDRAGRVRVRPDLSVQDHPEVFVVGDTAYLEQDGKPLPGVAQVAMQEGRHVGKLIAARVTGSTDPAPFRYFDKGNLAVVGKGFAVLQSGKVHMSGYFAWLVWVAVHLFSLAQPSLRISVLLQWIWTYTTGQRGSQLIVKHTGG